MYPTETPVAPPVNGGTPVIMQLHEAFQNQNRTSYSSGSQNQPMQAPWDHSSSKSGNGASQYTSHSQSTTFPVSMNGSGQFTSTHFANPGGQQLPPLAHFNDYVSKTSQLTQLRSEGRNIFNCNPFIRLDFFHLIF